jgi:hypothetical protein
MHSNVSYLILNDPAPTLKVLTISVKVSKHEYKSTSNLNEVIRINEYTLLPCNSFLIASHAYLH